MDIAITDAALTEIKKVGGIIKISIESGGCAGFSYVFTQIDEGEIKADDYVINQGNTRVVIEGAVQFLLQGSNIVLDYKKTLQEVGFCLQNNILETARCGCGKSVSLQLHEEDDQNA